MKKNCICFLLLVSSTLFGQVNLVPNPSFEDTVSCPDAGGQVYNAAHWYNVKNTPDYFNPCCVYPQFSVPNNIFGYHNAATGDAYCGLYTYYPPPYSREFFGVQLTSPLIIGTLYYVSFKVSSCKSDVVQASTAANKTGILFSVNKYDLNNIPTLNNFAHIKTDSIITDTLNWTVIKSSFIADSAYQFLTIGNFFTNSNTDTLHYFYNSNGSYAGYYVIDDVCVSTDSNTCFNLTGLNTILTKEKATIFPNPASDFIAISFDKSQDAAIRLVDLLGNTILTSEVINKKECSINVSAVAAGCYFLQIVNKRTGTTTTKKIMII